MKKQVFLVFTVILVSSIISSMSVMPLDEQDPWVVPPKYEKLKNPYADAKDTDNIGRILYSKHCKSCHGSQGKGDGTKAKSIDTPVGDLTTDSFKDQSDGSMYYKSFIGRDDMPNFTKKIPDEEDQWLLINYIKTL